MLTELTLALLLSAPPAADPAPATGARRAKRHAATQPAATQPEQPATPSPAAAPATTPPPEPRPAPVEDTPDEDAVVLQARALLAEHDGNLPDALSLLRQAHERSPGNGDVAYDLARIAALEAGPRAAFAARDVEPFLTRTPATSPERILRGYLLARRGDAAGARAELTSVARLEPGRGELSAFAPPPRGLAASFRVGLFGQYDSNVLLIAGDVPSGLRGPSMSLDLNANLGFGEAAPWLQAGAFGRLGVHVANRDGTAAATGTAPAAGKGLGAYDSAILGAFLRASDRAGAIDWDVTASGTDVGINQGDKQFMQEGALRGTALLAAGALRPGVFVAGGYRNFDTLNYENSRDNRDGPFGSAGAQVEWGERALAVSGQLGFQLEQAKGPDQQERGLVAGVVARAGFGPVIAGLGVDYQLRDYASTKTGRRDHLVTPSLSVSAPAAMGLNVVAGYAFTKNVSNARDVSGVSFGYERHLAQLGVEGQW